MGDSELAGAIAVASKGTGDVYALLTDRADERGEYPVAQVDHETGDFLIVASSFERFVWFFLDKMRREFEPDGTDRDIHGYLVAEGEDEDEETEEPFVPWPFQDLDWMIAHDPGLARWRFPGE